KDVSNPYFDYEPSKCIVCSRCVRACEDIQGTFALTITGRGFESRVAAAGGDNFLASECVSCGACVQACPTATLTEKSLVQLGQPERAVITTCAYCGVGCGIAATPTGPRSVIIKGDEAHPANGGRLCSKGTHLGETVGLTGRLLHPMIGKRRANWDKALDLVAKKFRETIERYGPDSVAFYVSGQLLTEDYYVANKLMKGFIGSANIDTNSRLCMSSAVAGHNRAFGE
ncbi:molybdopterin-dependent oxidoreductase, partial [Streptomyces sp. SYSU K217416]